MSTPHGTGDRPVSMRAVFAFGLGCAFFGYAFIQRVAPSVITDELMTAFAVGGALLGNLSAFYFYAYASAQIPVGVLIDRYGPRRLMSSALLICAAGSVLFAWTDDIALASVGRLMIGFGLAFGYVGTMTIAAQNFSPARFASALGILQAVGMAGAVLGQAPFRVLVDLTGWREATMIIGAVGLLLAALIWIVVRDGERHGGAETRLFDGIRYALRNRQTWLNALIGMSLTAPMLAFAGLWAPAYLTTLYGVAPAQAGAMASVMFLAWGVAAPFVGMLSDRLGRRKPLIIGGFVLSTGSLLVLAFVHTLPIPLLYVLFVVNGFGGCNMVLAFALCRETTPLWARASALGVVNAAVTGSGALYQPLLGWLLDLNWDGQMAAGARIYPGEAYTAALMALVVTSVIGLLAALAVRETYGRQVVE